MPANDVACLLIEAIASDHRQQVQENCERCQTGQGRCLVEFMQIIADEEPDERLKP